MVSSRRLGSETSKTRVALLDAAEALMLSEGYAAVTSRRVAAEAGLKPQLVHYYFRAMDDLFLALHKRRTAYRLNVQAEALSSDQPLWALWEFCREPRGTTMTMEFVALANHREAIRTEMTASAALFRAEQTKALRKILKRYEVPDADFPPIVAAVLISSISRHLVIEEEVLELFIGHSETVAYVENFIRNLEGERLPSSLHTQT
jgi:TetR/AcrR family transcriptional regulator